MEKSLVGVFLLHELLIISRMKRGLLFGMLLK